ncbi:LPS translocon maturation chaperone LptM [Candidatus Igneacidithiobacillus taiwanensis]|jgi:predicted small lipoprotein YifL|nr:lipoprotein [Candidatus Igneacidithiobacillus taiwanensis]
MKHLRPLFLLLLLGSLALAGCGRKTALTLPHPSAPTTSTSSH